MHARRHARGGPESLLSDCLVAQRRRKHCVARVGELNMALCGGCKRSSRRRGPHGAPSDMARGSMRESAAACATTWLQPMKASRLRESGATRHAGWLARVHMLLADVFKDQKLTGPHCKSLQEVLTRGCRCHTLPSQSPLTVASLKCSQTTRYIRPTISLTTTCSQRNL